jgi:hypothetical protein
VRPAVDLERGGPGPGGAGREAALQQRGHAELSQSAQSGREPA